MWGMPLAHRSRHQNPCFCLLQVIDPGHDHIQNPGIVVILRDDQMRPFIKFLALEKGFCDKRQQFVGAKTRKQGPVRGLQEQALVQGKSGTGLSTGVHDPEAGLVSRH